MSNQITSSVVRLISQNGTVAGIGYLASENRIITCAHMVAQALGIPKDTEDKPDAELRIAFPSGKNRTARVLLWRKVYQDPSLSFADMEDLAVLEFTDEPKDEVPAANILADDDYESMIEVIKHGEFIPFLGAGVNLCDRAEGERWTSTSQYLPSGEELSMSLAADFGYPWPDNGDLLRVSQYVALMHTLDRLNQKLRAIFNKDYPPTSLHRFFATLPQVLNSKGYRSTFLMVTTNYDDLLEQAFNEVGVPFDLVTYKIGNQNDQRGKFLHWTPNGRTHPIDDPHKYDGIKLDKNGNLVNPVILKVHGAVDRSAKSYQIPRDSYVITEDHYLEYLTHSDITALVPKTLKAMFSQRSFLFLGYSLRDWNLRVFLNRIQAQQQQNSLEYRSWAIQKRPAELEQQIWRKRYVEIFDANLRDYITELSNRVQALPPGGGAG